MWDAARSHRSANLARTAGRSAGAGQPQDTREQPRTMTVGIHRPTRWISASLLSEGKRAGAFWLCLCVAVSVGYAWRVVGDPLVNDYVVQDDARQHAFWAARYANPEAFPGDLTADYAQSVAPIGYGAVYRLASAVGVDVQTTNKALPLVLGPATAVAAFQLTMAVAGLPSVAFVASFILNQ